MDFCNIALFENVSHHDCERMMQCFHATNANFPAGAVICDYEKTSGRIGIVLKGMASLIRTDENGSRTILERVEEGGLFGECFAFSGNQDAIYVTADTDCEISFITYDEISKRCSNACACHTQITENLFRLISEKALGLSERVEVLSRRSIRDRLLCYFNLCADHAKQTVFSIPFTGTALADYLCVDRSAMLREIRKLKNEGMIEMEKRQVTARFLQ
ncbi:Crp/Fnr family transcriptional regulator [Ruminococcus champanellensis]|uniref:Crp/Fnr family transcriptional regulator n=1 Tax=Ruminococcus champanellensis TaxID=1161942 RepID=UPI00248C5760|nr:Crp/Fnr family transcriptional regulator [Ruminococcus champanellensis]